jgi:hypothetical protein
MAFPPPDGETLSQTVSVHATGLILGDYITPDPALTVSVTNQCGTQSTVGYGGSLLPGGLPWLPHLDEKTAQLTLQAPPPMVTITPFAAVSKDGEITVPVSVSGGSVTLQFDPVGRAKFVVGGAEQDTLPLSSGQNQMVTIRGKVVSSAVDDVKLVAKDSTPQPVGQPEAFSVVAIQKLEWVQKTSPLDANPNAGGGGRMFPKQAGLVLQNAVNVRATLMPPIAGVTVFFRSIDVDDPSANSTPMDDETKGQDNRASTTVPSPINDGKFTASSTNETSATTTVTAGVASAQVEFQVTMQPGDNFRIVATGINQNASNPAVDLTNVQAVQNDGTLARVKDAAGNFISSDLTTVAAVKASEVLTVWRKLHVEVDSMGSIPAPPNAETNVVKGTLVSIEGDAAAGVAVKVVVATIAPHPNLDDGSARLDNSANLGNGRFENGTITIGSGTGARATGTLRGNGVNYVEKAAANGGITIPCTITKAGLPTLTGQVWKLDRATQTFSVKVSGTVSMLYNNGQITVAGVGMTIQSVTGPTVKVMQLADIPFELLDDDAATMPHVPDISAMQVKFADAYILPVIDGGGDPSNNKTTVPFKQNITAITASALAAEYENAPGGLESDGSRTDGYWVGYVLTAYQSHPDPTRGISGRADRDPNVENRLGGATVLTGSIMFLEEIEDEDRQVGTHQEPNAVVHEVGHQFQLPDRGIGGGLMGPDFVNPAARFIPEDLDTLRRRVKSPGRFQP